MQKKQIRNEILTRRMGLTEKNVEKLSEIVCFNVSKVFYLPANIVGIYYPMKNEVNSVFLLKYQPMDTLLPFIDSINSMELKIWDWKNDSLLEVGKFNTRQPLEKSKTLVPDVIFVPLVAFDEKCNRIGYGGGYYDKYLSENNDILKVGLAFEMQKIHKITPDIHDVPLDFIVTENNVYER